MLEEMEMVSLRFVGDPLLASCLLSLRLSCASDLDIQRHYGGVQPSQCFSVGSGLL